MFTLSINSHRQVTQITELISDGLFLTDAISGSITVDAQNRTIAIQGTDRSDALYSTADTCYAIYGSSPQGTLQTDADWDALSAYTSDPTAHFFSIGINQEGQVAYLTEVPLN